MSSIWTPGGEVPVERGSASRSEAPPPSSAGTRKAPTESLDQDLSPEQQAQLEAELAAMQKELLSTPAAVVIANHAIGLFQLAALHLSADPPHLEEGQLAIDALGALVEGLGTRLGDHESSLKDALTQLRMAFVQVKARGATPNGE